MKAEAKHGEVYLIDEKKYGYTTILSRDEAINLAAELINAISLSGDISDLEFLNKLGIE